MKKYYQIISNINFLQLLFLIDKSKMEKLHFSICIHCGKGKYHLSKYERKPRGLTDDIPKEFQIMFSLCCSECRKRYYLSSLRFLGRKVYFSTYIILISCLRYGPNKYRLKKLNELFEVSPQTIACWRKWWKEIFPATDAWQKIKGCLNFANDLQADLPYSLFLYIKRLYNKNIMCFCKVVLLIRLISGIFQEDQFYAEVG